jgi:membrane peptidoglycan carboxypeptidase
MVGLCLLAGVLLAGVLAPISIGLGVASNTISDSVDSINSDLANAEFPLVTTVTDRTGAPIAYLFDNYRLPVSFNEISPNMTSALISIEDRRFYDNSGIDVKGMLRAAFSNSSGGSTQGGSTITQQYVKNFLINVVDRNDKTAQAADQAPSLFRKLREAKAALTLDQKWSKNTILTGYLNVVQFGSTGIGPYGVRAAAKAFFNTTPDKLTVPQAALLAGMVNNPVLYNPYRFPQNALKRRNLVIDKMVDNHKLSASDAAVAKAAPIGIVPGGLVIPKSTCIGAAPDAGFLCEYAINYLQQAGFTHDQINTGGYTIKTTMDPKVAQATKDAVDANVSTTQFGVANTFAVISPGAQSHEVLAMVANRNYGNDPNQGQTLTNILSTPANHFGSGSSFKIFTSAAALENGVAGLNTALPDPGGVQACGSSPGGKYRTCHTVVNDGNYGATMNLQQALATSPNTLFTLLEQGIGLPKVVQMAYRLGLRHTLSTSAAGYAPDPKSTSPLYNQSQLDYYQYQDSFTLGVSPVSPLEMANVSATVMSGGVWCPPNPILSVTDRYGQPVHVNQQACEQVITPGVASALKAGLSLDTISGTSANSARAAGWTHPDIGKTGTTNESESVAFVGGVNNYAVSSMLFADGKVTGELCPGPPIHLQPLRTCGHGLFGGTGAAPAYYHSMSQIIAGQPDMPIPPADPAFTDANNHGPIVPYVIGQQGTSAQQALQGAGYPFTITEFNSSAPRGQVIGQTPQGNAPPGTPISLYVSTGVMPAPQDSTPPPSVAPGSTGSH